MKKLLYFSILYLVIATGLGCKKDRSNPNNSDTEATAALQGKWRAAQQFATVNGQPDGEPTYFDGDQAIFDFSENQLKSYDGNDPSTSLRQYTFKVVNGELILREQYAASAQVYRLSFDGNNRFDLVDSYTSGEQKIVITIRFSRK